MTNLHEGHAMHLFAIDVFSVLTIGVLATGVFALAQALIQLLRRLKGSDVKTSSQQAVLIDPQDEILQSLAILDDRVQNLMHPRPDLVYVSLETREASLTPTAASLYAQREGKDQIVSFDLTNSPELLQLFQALLRRG